MFARRVSASARERADSNKWPSGRWREGARRWKRNEKRRRRKKLWAIQRDLCSHAIFLLLSRFYAEAIHKQYFLCCDFSLSSPSSPFLPLLAFALFGNAHFLIFVRFTIGHRLPDEWSNRSDGRDGVGAAFVAFSEQSAGAWKGFGARSTSINQPGRPTSGDSRTICLTNGG